MLSTEELTLLNCEETLESPLDCKKIKPVNPKGNQSWIFIGGTNAEAEAPIIWPPDAKSRHWKDPGAGKDWKQEEKGMTEDEMVRWHHWLNGHEFKQAPGDGQRQGSLACCSPCGHRVGHGWVNSPFSHSRTLSSHPTLVSSTTMILRHHVIYFSDLSLPSNVPIKLPSVSTILSSYVQLQSFSLLLVSRISHIPFTVLSEL